MTTAYRIVYVKKAEQSAGHNHIVEVGTGEKSDGADKKWLVSEVRAVINSGDSFYTQSASTNRQSKVEPFDCSCNVKTIRTNPDDVKDNNLDELRSCVCKS